MTSPTSPIALLRLEVPDPSHDDSAPRKPTVLEAALADIQKEGILTVTLLVGSVSFASTTWGQRVWETYIVRNFTNDQLFGPGIFIYTSLVFWVAAGLFSILDLAQWPRSLYKYKTQPTKSATRASWLKAAVVSLRNMITINIPIAYAVMTIAPLTGMTASSPLPAPITMVRDFVLSSVVVEVLFYYPHRLMHHPMIYKRIHKIHHEYTASIGVAATYAHPIEHILDIIPIFAGPILCGSHFFTMAVWVTIALTNTVSTHSGFVIPGLANPLHHDYHHKAFNTNYGVTGWLDKLHGTDRGKEEYARSFYKRMADMEGKKVK